MLLIWHVIAPILLIKQKLRPVTVLKPKPKTEVLRWNQTTSKPQFSGGHATVFLEFQKWPSPVTNVPKQQPNYCLSQTPASTVWIDRLTAQSGVARQPNYSLWQVDLCAAVGAIRTDVVHTGGLPAMQTNTWMAGEKVDWLMHAFLWEIVMITIHCRRRNK